MKEEEEEEDEKEVEQQYFFDSHLHDAAVQPLKQMTLTRRRLGG